MEAYPELLDYPDRKTVLQHGDILPFLLSGFFPPMVTEEQLGYIAPPFSRKPIYLSKDFLQILKIDQVEVNLNIKEEEVQRRMISNACNLILDRLYHYTAELSYPTVISIRDNESRMERHLRINIITDFVEVQPKKPIKKLSKAQIQEMMVRPMDLDLWLKNLPPDHFEFCGLLFVYLTDITEMEILSRLKDKMLGKHPTPFHEDIDFVQHQLRSYFNNPNVSMGIMSLDHSFALMVEDVFNLSTTALGKRDQMIRPEMVEGSIYQQVWQTKESLIIDDLSKLPNKTAVEQILLDQGIQSILLYPSAEKIPASTKSSSYFPRKPKHLTTTALSS